MTTKLDLDLVSVPLIAEGDALALVGQNPLGTQSFQVLSLQAGLAPYSSAKECRPVFYIAIQPLYGLGPEQKILISLLSPPAARKIVRDLEKALDEYLDCLSNQSDDISEME